MDRGRKIQEEKVERNVETVWQIERDMLDRESTREGESERGRDDGRERLAGETRDR